MTLCTPCLADLKEGRPVNRTQCLWCGQNVCLHFIVKGKSLCIQCEAMKHGE